MIAKPNLKTAIVESIGYKPLENLIYIRNPDHRILVSSVCAWKIATKYRIGKLPEAKQIVAEYSQILHQAKFIELALQAKI